MIISRISKIGIKVNKTPYYLFGTKTFKGLPFKIKAHQARINMIGDVNYFSQSIPDLPAQGETIRFREIFLPFYSANFFNIRTKYRGYFTLTHTRYQTRKNEKDQDYQHAIHTHQRLNVSGYLQKMSYFYDMKELQVYADFQYPRNAVQTAVSVDLKQNPLQQLNVFDLQFQGRKKEIKKHQMSNQLAIDKMMKIIKSLQTNRAAQLENANKKYKSLPYSTSINNVTITDIEIDQEDLQITLKSFYLPAYIFKSKMVDDVFKIVGGFTGNCSGLQITNSKKVGFTMMGVTALIGFPLWQTPQQYALLCSGVYFLGYFLGKMYNQHNKNVYHADQKQKQSDFNYKVRQQQQDKVIHFKQKNDHRINSDSFDYPEKKQLQIIKLTDAEAVRLKTDLDKRYSLQQFIEICDIIKDQIKQNNKDRHPRVIESLLKEVKKVEAEVLKRHKLN